MAIPEWLDKWVEKLDNPIDYVPKDMNGNPYDDSDPIIIGDICSSDYSDVELDRSVEEHQLEQVQRELNAAQENGLLPYPISHESWVELVNEELLRIQREINESLERRFLMAPPDSLDMGDIV